MDIERDFGVAVPSTIGQLMNFPRRERANRDIYEHAPVYATEVRFHLAILTGVWLPCHPSIRPSVRPAVRPPTSLVLVIPSISAIAAAVGEGTRGSVIGVNPRDPCIRVRRESCYHERRGHENSLSQGRNESDRSEAGRKRAIKGNNSGGGHIVPRASAGLPWDGTAASYATRAIMNDEIASRFRSDTNFPERPHDEQMKFLSSNLFKWQCHRFSQSRDVRFTHTYIYKMYI